MILCAHVAQPFLAVLFVGPTTRKPQQHTTTQLNLRLPGAIETLVRTGVPRSPLPAGENSWQLLIPNPGLMA